MGRFLHTTMSGYLAEGYDDVSVDSIRSRKKLDDYKNYDDRMEAGGNTYLHFRERDSWHLIGRVIAFDNDGTEMGNSMYGKPRPASPMKATIDVRGDKRRTGVASTIYGWIEELTGEKLHPDVPHSGSAEAFWANPRRKFGV